MGITIREEWGAMTVHDEASSPRNVSRLTTLLPSAMLEECAEELDVVARDQRCGAPLPASHPARSRERCFYHNYSLPKYNTISKKVLPTITTKPYSANSTVPTRTAPMRCYCTKVWVKQKAQHTTLSEQSSSIQRTPRCTPICVFGASDFK